GDVGGNADEALGLALLIAQQAATGVNPAIAAIGMAQAVDILVGLVVQLGIERVQRVFLIIRMQACGPVLAGITERLRGQPEQFGVAFGKEDAALGNVPVPEPVASGIQCQAQTLLIAGQLQTCSAELLGMSVQNQVKQRAGQHNEEQSLERLQALLQLHGEPQGCEQLITETDPQTGQ